MKTLVKYLIVPLFVLGIILPAHAYKLPAYSKLCEHLKDLKGWQAEKCTGMNMTASPMGEVVSATRSYSMGDESVNAVIVSGMQATSYWAPFAYNMQMDSDDQFVKITKIKGFSVGIIYNKKDKSGNIAVLLKKSGNNTPAALFNIGFNNMDWEKALDIAKKFNWTAMKNLF